MILIHKYFMINFSSADPERTINDSESGINLWLINVSSIYNALIIYVLILFINNSW
jgi:hypothetical protein